MVYPVAGGGLVGDGAAATAAQLASPEGIAFGPGGYGLIADSGGHRLRRVSPAGVISTVSGNGTAGAGGDGGDASRAQLASPHGVAVDAAGNIYVADFGNGKIRRIGLDGRIQTIAGGGGSGRAPSTTASALAVRFAGPRNLAMDGAGNLYISDHLDHRVYRLSPDGQLQPFAGTGVNGKGEGNALSARLSQPAGLAVDSAGSVYIADHGNDRICKVSGGTLTTVAGRPGDAVELSGPTGVAVDRAGNLYIADPYIERLLVVAPTGMVRALIETPARDVAVDASGAVYVSTGRQVVRINGDGQAAPYAGDGTYAAVLEGVPAAAAHLGGPIGLAMDGMRNLYIAEERNLRIRRVDPIGIIRTVAGNGERRFAGDGGAALAASFTDPVAVASDAAGLLRIADYQGNRVRALTAAGIVYSLAGTGEAGYGGDSGSAGTAVLNRPRGLALDRYGNLYIADSLNHRVRRVTASGMITTIAGTGIRGYYGDGGPATGAHLNTPSALAFDGDGNLYIADTGNDVIRRVNAGGIITTAAGSGMRGFSGDGGPAHLASFHAPTGIAADAAGNLFIADSFNHRIRCVTPNGAISTVAGTGVAGLAGDNGPALEARFNHPAALLASPDGAIYVADLDSNRVRKLIASPELLPPAPVLDEITVLHGATFRSGPVAPGQLISIFGSGLGPAQAARARLTAEGTVATEVEETQVLIGGAAAPLFYVHESQINAQVPYSVRAGESVVLEVRFQGKPRGRQTIDVAAAAPGVFTLLRGVGQAVILNQDGTLNSVDNPAARGSVITLYLTGEGLGSPPAITGLPARAPYPAPVLPLSLRIGSRQAEILFAGGAPGLVGLLQINARLPGAFSPDGVQPLAVAVGDFNSQPGVTMALR